MSLTKLTNGKCAINALFYGKNWSLCGTEFQIDVTGEGIDRNNLLKRIRRQLRRLGITATVSNLMIIENTASVDLALRKPVPAALQRRDDGLTEGLPRGVFYSEIN